MYKLISWTGWTKEDWRECFIELAKGVGIGIIVWAPFFIVDLIG